MVSGASPRLSPSASIDGTGRKRFRSLSIEWTNSPLCPWAAFSLSLSS